MNTSYVTDMINMFDECFKLKDIIGVENWYVSNVIDMNRMFSDCFSLTTIYANSNWQIVATKLTTSMNMFDNCSNLVGAVSYNSSNVDISMANPGTGYFTRKHLNIINNNLLIVYKIFTLIFSFVKIIV